MMSHGNHAFVYPPTTSRPSEHHMEDTMSREIDDLVLRFQKLSLNDCETNQTIRSTVLQRNDAFDGVSTTLSHTSTYPIGHSISEDHIEDLILRFQKLSLNDCGNGQTVSSNVLQRNDAFVDTLTASRQRLPTYTSRKTTSEDIEDLIIQFQKLSLNDNENSQTITGTVLQKNGALVGPLSANRSSSYPIRKTTSEEDIEDLIFRFQKLSLNDSEDDQAVTNLVLRENHALVGSSTTLATILAPQLSACSTGGITIFEGIEDLRKLRFHDTIFLRKCEIFVGPSIMNLSFECLMSGKEKDLMQQFESYQMWLTNGPLTTQVNEIGIIDILNFKWSMDLTA